MIEETSAGIVLFRRDNEKNLFLLLKYPAGHWEFVKGKTESNESLHETAIREMREETGITDVQFLSNFEEHIQYTFEYDELIIHKKVVFFLAETVTSDIDISCEHLDFAWLDYDTALETITFDNAKQVLNKAHDILC